MALSATGSPNVLIEKLKKKAMHRNPDVEDRHRHGPEPLLH